MRFLLLVSVLSVSMIYTASSLAASDFRQPERYIDFGDKSRWMVRGRLLMVEPNESASIDTIGGRVDIDEQYVPELDVTYFFTKHIAAELIAAVTPHDVTAYDTALGQVDLGDVWLLPPALTLQYHFAPDATFRPYVGAGLNYTHFFNANSGAVDRVKYDNSVGYVLQAGADYELDETWALNLDIKRVNISPDVTIHSGAARINADVDIDPWIFGVGLSYRF